MGHPLRSDSEYFLEEGRHNDLPEVIYQCYVSHLGKVCVPEPGTQTKGHMPAETVWEQVMLMKGRGSGKRKLVVNLVLKGGSWTLVVIDIK